MPASRYSATALLNALFGQSSSFGALATAPTIYVALLVAATTTTGTTTSNGTALSVGATTVTVASAAGITTGTKIAIGPDATGASEVVTVSAVSTNTLTISATVNGHANGAPITIVPLDTTTGSGLTAEASYTGYARVSSAGAWSAAVAGSPSSISNGSAISFGACTAGSQTVTYFVFTDAASAGNVIAYGPLTSTVAVSQNIQPQFAAGQLSTTLA